MNNYRNNTYRMKRNHTELLDIRQTHIWYDNPKISCALFVTNDESESFLSSTTYFDVFSRVFKIWFYVWNFLGLPCKFCWLKSRWIGIHNNRCKLRKYRCQILTMNVRLDCPMKHQSSRQCFRLHQRFRQGNKFWFRDHQSSRWARESSKMS